MQTTHLPGRGLVVAVVSLISVRHDSALGLVDTGLYLDLSRVPRNPADDPGMRFRTGPDDDVYVHVLKIPGALTLFNRAAVQLRALADEVPVGRLVRLTVACQGGRYRSVGRTTQGHSAMRRVALVMYGRIIQFALPRTLLAVARNSFTAW
ncbi:RapZ C-terminal domain-containing protein [Streptomyces sp. NPDC055607]